MILYVFGFGSADVYLLMLYVLPSLLELQLWGGTCFVELCSLGAERGKNRGPCFSCFFPAWFKWSKRGSGNMMTSFQRSFPLPWEPSDQIAVTYSAAGLMQGVQ